MNIDCAVGRPQRFGLPDCYARTRIARDQIFAAGVAGEGIDLIVQSRRLVFQRPIVRIPAANTDVLRRAAALVARSQPSGLRIETKTPDGAIVMKSVRPRRVNRIPAILAVPNMNNLIYARSGEPSLIRAEGDAIHIFPG